MELFAASTIDPLKVAEESIINSDLVIVLLANKYGYIPSEVGISITEWEYNKAIELKKPIFAFLLQENYPWPTDQIDFTEYSLLQKIQE